MLITKLKIFNFMSFVGRNEVSLKHYTSVMYSCDTGKKDFVSALHFLFGASLAQLGFSRVTELYHDCLVSNAAESDIPLLEVSATVQSQNGYDFQLSRSVINMREVFAINGTEVIDGQYGKLIAQLSLGKKFFLSLSEFQNAVWESDGFDRMLFNFVGVDLKRTELKAALKEWRAMRAALALQNEKQSLAMLHLHKDVDQVVDQFEKVLHDQEARREKTMESLSFEIEDPSSVSESFELSPPLQNASSSDENFGLILTPEQEISAENKLSRVRMNEGTISATILHHESKIAAVEGDITAIQERIALKVKMERRLAQMQQIDSEIWEELKSSSDEISYDMAELERFRCSRPKNRLTAYGRLIDWIRPGVFLWVLRAVLGEELLHGHLVSNQETAEKMLKLLQVRHVEARVSFIVLSEFPPQLADTLFSGGESGHELKDLVDVLKLLSKLKQVGLVSCVPSIFTSGQLQLDSQEEAALFCSTGEFVDEGGVFGRYDCQVSIDPRPAPDILDNVNTLLARQDMLFERAREQSWKMCNLRLDVDAVAEDARSVRASRSNKHASPPSTAPQPSLPPVYADYSEIFEEHRQMLEETSEEDCSPPAAVPAVDLARLKADVKELKGKMVDLSREKKDLEQQLKATRNQLTEKLTGVLQMRLIVAHPFLMPQPKKNKSLLAFDLQLKALRKVIRKDEVEELKVGREWRNTVLRNLRDDLNEAKKAFKDSSKAVEDVQQNIVTQLAPFMGQRVFAPLLQRMVGVLDSGELCFEGGESVRLMVGARDGAARDLADCNVFLRVATLLALCLSIARLSGGPLLVLDDLSELLPRSDLDVFPALGLVADDVEMMADSRFYLLTRIGNAVKMLLDGVAQDPQNTSRAGKRTTLEQVIWLCREGELAVTTDNYLLTVQDVAEDARTGNLSAISRLF